MEFLDNVFNKILPEQPGKPEEQNYWNDTSVEEFYHKSLDQLAQSARKFVNKQVKEQKKKIKEIRIHMPNARARDQGKRVTSPYGPRTLHINGKEIDNWHIGTDYSSGTSPALAVEDVLIKRIGPVGEKPCRFSWDNTKKTWVEVATRKQAPTPYVVAQSVRKSNLVFKYKHVKPLCSPGQVIEGGMPLGECGNYGYSMGAHLHFEVWYRGRHMNPEAWFTNMQEYIV